MTKAKENLNCWQRAEEKTFKVLLFSKLILCLLTVMILWVMYSYQFFARKTTQVVAHSFTLLFLAIFVVLSIVNTLTVICRYRRQKKLCSRTNCSFIWVMLLIFVLSIGIASKVVSKGRDVEHDLS
jgi:cytochrome bd-type quinol oxidase subunit 2